MDNNNELKLWYDKQADAPIFNEKNLLETDEFNQYDNNWDSQGLPIGNGNVGGMVFGRTDKEIVQINEITLWSGGPNKNDYPIDNYYDNKEGKYTGGNRKDAHLVLKEIREKLFCGDISGAESLQEQLTGYRTGWESYQNLGEIAIEFLNDSKICEPVNYKRELDLRQGLIKVSYENEGRETLYKREYFCSFPDNVMVIHLTAAGKHKVEFSLDLKFDDRNSRYEKISKTNISYRSSKNKITGKGMVTDSKMLFETQIMVTADSGAIVTAKSDGSLQVENAADVMILMSSKTDFKNENHLVSSIDNYPEFKGSNPHSYVTKIIEKAAVKSFNELLSIHLEDYSHLFKRTEVSFGSQFPQVTTDKLLDSYGSDENNSRYLEELLFQYGRYLLISSSRNSLPANLQGLWNDSNIPPWGSDYHFDVNVQMCYWHSCVANISETVIPLIDMIHSYINPGKVTAKEHYGVDNGGWVINAQTNPFGFTAVGYDYVWGWTPGSAAWVCQNLWDYYLFTEDKTLLKSKIYETMKGQALFWKGFLITDPNTGELVTAPSTSPEHGRIGIGSTYDMVMAYICMKNVIKASEILGVDKDFRDELNIIIGKMQPLKIGKSGQIKEWREEEHYNKYENGEDIGDPNHRHISHLLALFPGDLITDETKDYMDAAIKTLDLRSKEPGFGSGGWGLANRANLRARTHQGNEAYENLYQLIKNGINMNLLSYIPDICGFFQIDANFGLTSAVCEMLIQSHAGYIELLPALPRNWEQGHFKGFKARGNIEIDCEWNKYKINRVNVTSNGGHIIKLKYKDISKCDVTSNGKTIKYKVVSEDLIEFKTNKNKVYEITLN